MIMKIPPPSRWGAFRRTYGAQVPRLSGTAIMEVLTRARRKGPPVTYPYEDLAVDLISRTEKAVRRIGSLSADTGIQFEVEDAVDAVERDLPSDYPAPADSDPPRRDLIARIVEDILSGAMYEE